MGVFKALGDAWDDFCDQIALDRELGQTDREISRHGAEKRRQEALKAVTEAKVTTAISQRTAVARVMEAELEAQRKAAQVGAIMEVEKWDQQRQIGEARANLHIAALNKQQEYIEAQTRVIEAQAEQQFYASLASRPAQDQAEMLDAYAQKQRLLYTGAALRQARLTGIAPDPEMLQPAQSIRSNTIPGLAGPNPSDQDIERIARQSVLQARKLPPDEMDAFWTELPNQLLTRYPELVVQEILARALELQNMTITG